MLFYTIQTHPIKKTARGHISSSTILLYKLSQESFLAINNSMFGLNIIFSFKRVFIQKQVKGILN
jgi:hypothetical protein